MNRSAKTVKKNEKIFFSKSSSSLQKQTSIEMTPRKDEPQVGFLAKPFNKFIMLKDGIIKPVHNFERIRVNSKKFPDVKD